MASPINLETGIDFTRVDVTQKFALGMEITANDGCTYKYCRAGAGLTADNFVIVDVAEGAYDVVHSTAVEQPCAGIAPVAATDNYFTWIKIRGKHVAANVATGALAGSDIGSSSTEGRFAELPVTEGPVQSEVEAIVASAAGVAVTVRVTASGNKAEVVLT